MKKSFSSQIWSLIAIIVLFFVLLMGASLILQIKGVDQWRMLMALSFLQNIGVFIIPSLIVARIFNPHKTMQVLQLNRMPKMSHILLMILIYFASIPMMHMFISWNESWQLPAAMSGLEAFLRAAEESAGAATEQMLSASTIGQLILIIFVMGVLTGIGEELLFRGSVQRLFSENGTNVHLAIWITAFIFSAVHMQFYGLVPRMLIGAFLGYLYVWSGSLWLPIMGHALNNSVAVLGYRYEEVLSKIEWYNETPSLVAIAVSCVATALLIYLSWRLASKTQK